MRSSGRDRLIVETRARESRLNSLRAIGLRTNTSDTNARSVALAVEPQLERYENCHHHRASL